VEEELAKYGDVSNDDDDDNDNDDNDNDDTDDEFEKL
jgi:hypothetical protein